MGKMSRRTFAKVAGTAALASSATTVLTSVASRAESPSTGSSTVAPATGREFPNGFLWGSATASYQVEGAVNEDAPMSIPEGP